MLRKPDNLKSYRQLSGHVSGCGPTEAYAREAVQQNAEILQVDFHDLNGGAYVVVED